MPGTETRLMTVYADALERSDPAARAAYSTAPVGETRSSVGTSRNFWPRTKGPTGSSRPGAREGDNDRSAGPGLDATLAKIEGAVAERHIRSEPATVEHGPGGDRSHDRPQRYRQGCGDGHRRAVHAARTDRRGRHGHRLAGRADRAGQAQGRPQADQRRAGNSQDGPRPVRRRTPGAGADGPPQHRPGLRRRHHRRGSAVLRDGARQGRPDHRLLRPAQLLSPRPAAIVRRGLPGRAARPPEGDHPPRPQALERHGHRGQTASPRPRSSTSAWPRRPGLTAHRHRAFSDTRRDRRHAAVHVARAGRPVDA